ncbi:hypothetical protein ABS198_22270, partial [Acinetobacter baumannii]|uniref:hypothetical protein n=1 Tax=Acinetobacter baumannii TaxID=470 RepID=UPI00332542F5
HHAQRNVDFADPDVTTRFQSSTVVQTCAITFPEDLNGDGILNAAELGTDGRSEERRGWKECTVVGRVGCGHGTVYRGGGGG